MANARSMAGTHWQCIDPSMPEYKRIAVITEGNMDPHWNGENPIQIQFDNGKNDEMTLRNFQSKFKQIIQVAPRNVVSLHARRHA